MEENSTFEKIKADVEARQESILLEDQFRNNESVERLFWKGNPHARPVQRAGLLIFGIAFLLLGLGAFIASSEQMDDAKSGFLGILGVASVLIAFRLIWNAFRRSRAA